MQKKCKVIMPDYLQNFQCISSQCEDNCCIGWRIDIDEKTYKNYRNCRDEEIKEKINKKIKRNRTIQNHNKYAQFILNQESKCPFLDEQSLCELQTKLGWNYIPSTCKVYPRHFNQINNVVEKTASVSCPEIARLALLKLDGINFLEIEESFPYESSIGQKWNTDSIAFLNKPQRYLWELRIFTIQVLKSRDYQLWERLIILGMFYDKIKTYIEKGKLAEITVLIDSYTEMIEQGIFKEVLAEIPTKLGIQMELLKELADERVLNGVNSIRYITCFEEFLQGIKYYSDFKVNQITNNYKEAYEKCYQPFMVDKVPHA